MFAKTSAFYRRECKLGYCIFLCKTVELIFFWCRCRHPLPRTRRRSGGCRLPTHEERTKRFNFNFNCNSRKMVSSRRASRIFGVGRRATGKTCYGLKEVDPCLAVKNLNAHLSSGASDPRLTKPNQDEIFNEEIYSIQLFLNFRNCS